MSPPPRATKPQSKIPYANTNSPMALKMRCHGVGVLVSEFNTPMAIGEKLNSVAHSASETTGEMIRSSSQMATASIKIPKMYLTLSIHPPALGSLLTPAPMASSGAPIPRLMTNNDTPPSSASPVWPM